MGEVAYFFGFPPSELKALTLQELEFWYQKALEKSKVDF